MNYVSTSKELKQELYQVSKKSSTNVLSDLDYLEELSFSDEIEGGNGEITLSGEITQILPPFRVLDSWIVPFVSRSDEEVCLGAFEIEVDEVGGIVIASAESELLCVEV